MSTWPKIIRDPVHNIIPFENNDCDRLLLDLINTREFQRLRRIKQLGMSELVFPGANHSRFAHSIGVMNNARRILDRIGKVSPEKISDEQRTAVLAASLLHDVGHGPFSHTFEKITGEDHEARTLEVIRDDSTEIHQRLVRHDKGFPDVLAAFFDEDLEDARGGADVPPYLTHVVSSQLDADRFDYLLRDSYATGTDYGRFDDHWLIEHLQLDGERPRFTLSHKGLIAAEAYVFARYHMYRTVYFHKTTRAAEVMLRLAFKRFKHLLDHATSRAAREAVAPGVPSSIFSAFTQQKITLAAYLSLDDHTVTEFLKASQQSADPILASLANGLAERKLFKAVEASEAQAVDVGKFTTEAVQSVRDAHLDPDYTFVDDGPADIPYEPYDPDDAKPATQIYVQTTLGTVRELSTQSDAVNQLKKRYTLLRYYFPADIREKITEIAKSTLVKEKKP